MPSMSAFAKIAARGVPPGPTHLAFPLPRLHCLGRHPAETAGLRAAPSGPEAAADHRQHDVGGPADPPRTGGAGGEVRRAPLPPPWLPPFVAVSAPEYAREVLQARDGAFSNRPATTTYGRADVAFADSGAHVREMRKLCATNLFSRRRAETWLAVRDGYGALARDVGMRSGQAVNLGELVFSHTARVILWCGLQRRRPRTARVHRRPPRVVQDLSALDKFTDEIIHDHMRSGKNPADAEADLVDGLLAFLADVKLSKGKDGQEALRFLAKISS
ncbi:hypothetical protein D1007_37296 [Hordeum vulgare]|nr:hypothetical protein D1007_37296 [Hordeum vulgare]